MNKRSIGRWLGMTLITIAFAGGLAAAPLLVSAQDVATPVAGAHDHPVHIHLGTCDEVGEVAFPLNNIVSATETAATPAADEMSSPAAEVGDMYVAESTTTITGSLEDLLTAGHVINVHESEENIGNYIACGVVAGTPENGELTIMLTQTNESGWDGEAVLTDNGEGTIDVTVHLKAAEVDALASPQASPTS